MPTMLLLFWHTCDTIECTPCWMQLSGNSCHLSTQCSSKGPTTTRPRSAKYKFAKQPASQNMEAHDSRALYMKVSQVEGTSLGTSPGSGRTVPICSQRSSLGIGRPKRQ
ncbi:hypothetical protein F4819DRAFT_72373 [Hypoxylon fuscum]|nr:hypothetical protein F4819DRAFT_72373 [Hypoxylon fuscum]